MKKVLKRALSLFLAVAIILSSAYIGLAEVDFAEVFVVKAKAASEDGLLFSLNSDGQSYWVSSGRDVTGTEVVIPSVYNGLPVIGIGANAFNGCTKLVSVTIPDSVTHIGDNAFRACEGLVSFTMPDSVTSIGDLAFYECTGLVSVTISDSLKKIGMSAFNGCTSLASVTIPDSVTSIGYNAFQGCTALTSVNITDIAAWCKISFGGGRSNPVSYAKKLYLNGSVVTSVAIPDGITVISSGAFNGCEDLADITIPDSVTRIGTGALNGTAYYNNPDNWSGGLLYIGDYLIAADTSLSGACSIRNGTKVMADDAFYNCTGLTSITIPGSVKEVSRSAFSGCTSLTYATIQNGVVGIGDAAFYKCTSLLKIEIPRSIKSIGSEAFKECTGLSGLYITDLAAWCELDLNYYSNPLMYAHNLYLNGSLVTDLVIPDGVEKIGSYLFYACDSITSLTIPDSVKSINMRAFLGCSYLASVTLPDSVTSIGYGAFYSCSALTEITIPDSVTIIEDYAFYNCAALTAITVGKSVESIGYYAFGVCSALEKINWNAKCITNREYYTFKDSGTGGAGIDVVFGDGVESIPAYLFNDNGYSYEPSIKSVTFSGSVKSIGICAFNRCVNIKAVYITDIAAWCDISFGDLDANPLKYTNNLYINGALATDVVIPDGVTEIKKYAFYNCTYITSVSIPDSVTSIGYYAFYNCSKIKSITIPDSVTSIDKDAFNKCTSLNAVHISDIAAWCKISFKSTASNPIFYAKNLYLNGNPVEAIEIPAGVTSIGEYAFYNCANLTSVTISEGVTSIGKYAFCNCANLKSVTIPDGVTSIGEYAFNRCTSLTSVDMPDSVNSLGTHAFYGCTSLGAVSLSQNLTSIEEETFSGCTSLAALTIPASVTSVGASAFYNCTSIASVAFPSSVKSIGAGAFRDCTSLISISIPNSVTSIGARAFDNTGYFNKAGRWSGDVLYISNHLITAKTTLAGDYTIKTGARVIADSAFYGCTSVATITMPTSIRHIGDSAFRNCTGLTAVSISSNVTSIGANAFSNCTALSSVSIPDSVTSIGYYAFSSCSALVSVTIPDGVTVLNDGIFSACNKLSKVALPKNLTYIGNSAFYGCKSLASIRFPETLTSIGSYAFSGCSTLATVTIPDSVEKLDYYAFKGCTGLESVVIGGGVSYFGVGVFSGCTNISSAKFNKGIEIIGESAFEGCYNLRSINIPEGVTRIESFAFAYCKNIFSVKLPKSLTYINNAAFADCYGIWRVVYNGTSKGWNKVYVSSNNEGLTDSSFSYLGDIDSVDYLSFSSIPDTVNFCVEKCDSSVEGDVVIPFAYYDYSVTKIGPYAFADCTKMTSISIPVTIKIIEDNAFKNCNNIKDIFYKGTEEQWKQISIGINNDCLENVRIHFSCTGHTAAKWTIDEKATCLKEGSKHKECDVCGISFNEVTIPIITHNYPDTWEKRIAPGCTEEGVEYRCCIFCGTEETRAVVATGHKYGEWVEVKAPTCIETGVKQKTCEYCGGIIEEAIAVIDHTYSDEWIVDVAPTCTQEGRRHRSCTGCGLVKEEPQEAYNELVNSSLYPESDHDYDSSYESHSFSYDGAESLTITFSSSTYVESGFDYIKIYDSTGALYGKYTGSALKNVTLTLSGDSFTIVVDGDGDSGTEYYGFSLTSIVALMSPPNIMKPLGHDYSTEWTIDIAPTCITEGSKSHHCTRCESVTDVTVVGVSGHAYDNGVIDIAPTCTEEGSMHKTCTVCGDVVTETVSATGHTNTMWITEEEPTCTEAGYKDEYCLDCAEMLGTESIPATGHSYGDWIVDIAPTCTKTGSRHKICTACDDTVTETMSVVPHSYSTQWTIDVAPTCTAVGSKSHHCTVCGNKTDVTVVAATGHSYGDWIVDVEPTCTKIGSKHQSCSACGAVATQSISAKGHTYSTEWTIDVAPTCTEEGSKSHHCVDCDKAFADVTVIEALGHNYEVVSTAAEHPHTISSKCSRCDDTISEDVYSEKCAVCNFTYTDKDSNTCEITGYIGSSTTLVVPASIDGKTVVSTKTGAFKANNALVSVTIEDGVQSIGALAFLSCKSLSKAVVPASVTSIGANAFYNCASNFTLYCFRDSYAMQYAIDNSLNYVIMDIGETEACTIDYTNNLIFATETGIEDIEALLYVPETSAVTTIASVSNADCEYYGTGSTVTVVSGGVSTEYTVVISGDTNGDSVCDVLDCAEVERVSSGNGELTGAYAMAADSNSDDIIGINDYQAIVNRAIA